MKSRSATVERPLVCVSVKGALGIEFLDRIVAAQMLYWIQVEIPEEQAKEKAEAQKGAGLTGVGAGNERRYDTLIWGLNTIVQLVTLYCPGALVWYEPADSRHHPGSPLDLLPQV